MRRRGVIIGGAAALVLGGAGLTLWPAGAEGENGQILRWQDAETVALGQTIYADHCAACHGANLEGQPNWREQRENGRLPAPPHDVTGHTWHHPDALLVDITARGTAAVVGRGYESDMMGFADVLSMEEIIAVLSYIKSTWPAEIIAAHDEMNALAALE